MYMKCPKISNPNEFVDISVEDKGDKVPFYDVNGLAYECYWTIFKFNGEIVHSILDKAFVDASTTPVEVRLQKDCEELVVHDLDFSKALEVVQ